MNRDQHARDMRLFRRIFVTAFIGTGLFVVSAFAFQMWALYHVASNPQAAGEFVGQIVRGVVTEVTR